MPAPAAPGRLRLGDQHKSLRCAVLGPHPQSSVGAGQAVDDLNLQRVGGLGRQLRVDGGSVEHVGGRGEGIAAVCYRRYRDTIGPQCGDSFPDGGAAYAQLLRQLLPGDVTSPCGIQRGQHVRFYHGKPPLAPNCHPV